MGTQQYKPPDPAALLTVLGQAAALCRRLELPNDADVFANYTARVRSGEPIAEATRDEISSVINGIAGLRIIGKLAGDHSEFSRLVMAFSQALFPELHDPKNQRKRSLEERVEQHGDEILASATKAEARRWLQQRGHGFFKTNSRQVAGFVEEFYCAGAVEVLIAEIEKDGAAQLGQGLLVVLPKGAVARAKLFKIGSRAEEAFQNDPVADKGQKYLYYSLD